MSINKSFYSGTSGLVVPIPQSQYPPEFQGKSRLIYYASLFNSIEINSSFYKMPMISTVRKWEQSVPDEFRFTFKLSKTITHVRGLEYTPSEIDQFMQMINQAGSKKGCVLIQFPPTLHIDKINRLEKLLIHIHTLNEEQDWKIAVEFRHMSWYDDEVYDLLKKFKVSMVIHDLPSSATPLNISTADFMYYRFHGPGGRYRGSYEESFLQQYAQYIKAWSTAGKTVYFYFNNTMGDAFKNLITLNHLLEV